MQNQSPSRHTCITKHLPHTATFHTGNSMDTRLTQIGTDYLFSSRARPENLFPGKLRTEYLFSTARNF